MFSLGLFPVCISPIYPIESVASYGKAFGPSLCLLSIPSCLTFSSYGFSYLAPSLYCKFLSVTKKQEQAALVKAQQLIDSRLGFQSLLMD